MLTELKRKGFSGVMNTLLASSASTQVLVMTFAALALGFLGYKFVTASFGAGQPLKRNKKQKYRLIKKESVTHNTRRFRFEVASRLGLPCGSHLMVSVDGNTIERPYTPTEEREGYFDLMIKIYPDGKLTPLLDILEVGDYICGRGPLGMVRYAAPGVFIKRPKNVEIPCKNINMICGGTGITPMIQVLTEIFENPNDNTACRMIFGNITVDDILCFEEMEELQRKFKKAGKDFKIYYTLDKPPAQWDGGSGYVTPDMMTQQLFPGGKDTVSLLCGPPPMVRGCKNGLMDKLGHEKSRVISF